MEPSMPRMFILKNVSSLYREKCINKPYAVVSSSEFPGYFKCDCMPNGTAQMFILRIIVSSHPYQRKAHSSHEKRGWLKRSWRPTGSPGSTSLLHYFTLNPAGEVCLAHATAVTINHSKCIAFNSFSFNSAPVPFSCTFVCLEFARNAKLLIRT